MKELTPYEQFLADNLRNLPVPNEDMAWKEMKKLLEEKKDDRPLLPPFLKGCLPWLIIAILAAIGIVVWYNNTKNSHSNSHSSADHAAGSKLKKQMVDSLNEAGFSSHQNLAEKDSISPTNLSREDSGAGEKFKEQKDVTGRVLPSDSKIGSNASDEAATIASSLKDSPTKIKRAGAAKRTTETRESKSPKKTYSSRGKIKSAIRTPSSSADDAVETADARTLQQPEGVEKVAEAVQKNAEENVLEKDYADSTIVDSVDEKKPRDVDSLITQPGKMDRAVVSKDSSAKRKSGNPFTFAAGLSVNQYIPTNGEKPVPYDFMGRKGSLGDYIPSVYFRAMKPRWFIQSEFRYGAPNNVKEFVYSSKRTIDTFQTVTTSLKTLKKTFYHQVPVTFNYFVTKNWSVGIGIAYNKFTRAVRQEDVRVGIPGTTIDTLISSNLVQDGKDSAFVSNSFQWIAETQYRWRRFSLGLRFAQGLQPYIKYTDPTTGLPAEKKNQSLNAFLRFDLWRSSKK